MAVQITLDFTDDQWALVEEHFVVGGDKDSGQPIFATPENLKEKLEKTVRAEVTNAIRHKAAREQENAFDV